jgi:signal transduction histidine kinase
LSIAAHELKTPVTAVRGYAQLLRARDSAKPVQLGSSERALAVIERQSLKLGRLIEQLLNVSRIATGKLQIYSQASDIPALVRTAIDGLHATGDTHVLVQHGPEHLIADVDPLRIEQVIVNLLDNAAKYSPPDSRIDVLLEPIGEMRFQLVVQDHGSGIPADKRSHIFDRFYQAHAELHGSGMGLGLYISRQIIELHGGCISAEFPADGGTRVVISLPTTNASRRDPSQILVAGAR